MRERLAGYFSKYDKFSSACKPLLKPVALLESDSTKERQDPLELRRLLIRMCRAVASSNVLPSSPEGIALMIDAYHTRYARHGNLNDLFAQMMSSATLQHVFKRFLRRVEMRERISVTSCCPKTPGLSIQLCSSAQFHRFCGPRVKKRAQTLWTPLWTKLRNKQNKPTETQTQTQTQTYLFIQDCRKSRGLLIKAALL